MSRRNPIHIANWSDRHSHRGFNRDYGWRNMPGPGKRDCLEAARHNRFVFAFGSHSATYVMVFEKSLEDALEIAAEWLAENAPGHIMPAWGEEHTALVKEACQDAGLAYPPADGADLEAEGYYAAFERAEVDLTYTESGYLTSYEWTIVFENPSHAAVLELAGETGW